MTNETEEKYSITSQSSTTTITLPELITLWDYFAAHAPIELARWERGEKDDEWFDNWKKETIKHSAKACAEFADAMIEERRKRLKEEE